MKDFKCNICGRETDNGYTATVKSTQKRFKNNEGSYKICVFCMEKIKELKKKQV